MSGCIARVFGSEYKANGAAVVRAAGWQVSGRWAGMWSARQLASIRQISGQVSRGSAGEYQGDERAGVARLSWRVSGR